MSKRRFMIKDVTCNLCEGTGTLLDCETLCEETCPECEGKGYIVETIDKHYGFRVVTLEEENKCY